MPADILIFAIKSQETIAIIVMDAVSDLQNDGAMDDLDWIRKGLKRPGKTQVGLANALGRAPSAITNLLKNKRDLKTREVAIIQAYFDAEPKPKPKPRRRKMPRGEGGHIESGHVLSSEPFFESDAGISTVQPYKPTLPNASPVVASSLSAGGGSTPQTVAASRGGITYSADAVLGEISLPPAVSSSLTPAPTNRIHWFEVSGDSMEPTLLGGDWVGVNTTDVAIGQGGVFAIRDSNGEILVKRLRRLRGEDSNKVQIVSDNARQGTDTENLDSIVVFGRIVARISRVG